jgi:hypothetical protein
MWSALATGPTSALAGALDMGYSSRKPSQGGRGELVRLGNLGNNNGTGMIFLALFKNKLGQNKI